MKLTVPVYVHSDHCGYCNGSKKSPSVTMGFQVEELSLEEYDELIQLGFRRSGHFVYKMDLLRTCCPMYTIRTQWSAFTPRKEHRQDVKRFMKQLGVSMGGNESIDDVISGLTSMGRLEIKMETNEFTYDKYELFERYQKEIHHDDDTSKRGFMSFLCDSPLESSVSEMKGSLHQCYYLDNKLIAIAVLDILPSGISSVYFIYDPDCKAMVLGKISALFEMKFTQQIGLDWYYMGYYINDCVKMRYKAKFGGELLNPYDNKFIRFQDRDGFWSIDSQGEEVSKQQFGDEGEAFIRSNQALQIFERLGIEYKEGHRSLPPVVPGILELHQLLPLLEEMELKVEFGNDLMIVPMMRLTPSFQKTCLDLVRLLGMDLFKRSTLV